MRLKSVTTVRGVGDGDVGDCLGIVRALPEYFSEGVAEKVREDLGRHLAWVAVRGERVVGFVVVERKGPLAAEVLWVAVDAADRGQGIGRRLVNEVLREVRADGVRVVEVKTLDASASYEPYRATRAFWERMGFVQIDTIDPLPGWDPGNPAAIYVAALEPTTGRRPSEL